MNTVNEPANVVLEPKIALGVSDGGMVHASTLNSQARILLAAGASRILVPRPPSHSKGNNVRSEKLPPGSFERDALGKYIKSVDTDGRIERRVLDFLEPIHNELHEDSREATFVRLSATPIYRLLVATENKASVWDADVHYLMHELDGLRASRFPAKYRERFVLIVGTLASYRPVRFPGLLPSRRIGSDLMVKRLERSVDDLAFENLTRDYRKLGYLRSYGTAIRLLAKRAKRFVATPMFKRGLKVGSVPAYLAGGPAAGTAVSALGAASDLIPPDQTFAPPDLQTTEQMEVELWRTAMSQLPNKVRPEARNMAATFIEPTLIRCGHTAIGKGFKPMAPEAIVRAELGEWDQLLLAARRALGR